MYSNAKKILLPFLFIIVLQFFISNKIHETSILAYCIEYITNWNKTS